MRKWKEKWEIQKVCSFPIKENKISNLINQDLTQCKLRFWNKYICGISLIIPAFWFHATSELSYFLSGQSIWTDLPAIFHEICRPKQNWVLHKIRNFRPFFFQSWLNVLGQYPKYLETKILTLINCQIFRLQSCYICSSNRSETGFLLRSISLQDRSSRDFLNAYIDDTALSEEERGKE